MRGGLRSVGLKFRGVWFYFFFVLGRMFSKYLLLRRFFHSVKHLPYRGKIVSDDIVQCQTRDYLFLNCLTSSSSPEAADLRDYCKHYQIRQGDVVLDVGAHIGSFTIRSSKRIGNGLIVSFEPNPKSYRLLKMNVTLNGLTNVIPLNIALADFEGTTELSIRNDPAGSLLLPSGEKTANPATVTGSGSVIVRVRRIDDVCAEIGVKKVNLLKIHADGSELSILRGASDTLAKNDLNVAISSGHFAHQPFLQEVCRYLSASGYRLAVNGVSHPTVYGIKRL